MVYNSGVDIVIVDGNGAETKVVQLQGAGQKSWRGEVESRIRLGKPPPLTILSALPSSSNIHVQIALKAR